MPDFTAFHESLTAELYSVKDRIRKLVNHWPTDGEFKESALRTILRRHLPSSARIGRGFVVTSNDSSTQIDLLITHASKPVLFTDGDLMIVTPDAVLAVVEVKSKIQSRAHATEALAKLMKVEKMCRDATGRDSVWTGLFSFDEDKVDHVMLLRAVWDSYTQTERSVNAVSCGTDLFIRYWENGAFVHSLENGPVWHSYALPKVASRSKRTACGSSTETEAASH